MDLCKRSRWAENLFYLLVGRTNRHLTQHLAPAFICGKDDPFRRCHNRFGTHRFTTDWLSQVPIPTIVLEWLSDCEKLVGDHIHNISIYLHKIVTVL